MANGNVICDFYFQDALQNRKILFDKALACAKYGKVLYILPEELNELPQLSQDFNEINRHYMKMIIFLYAPNLESLTEGVSTLPDWKNVPSTIILEELSAYSINNFQKACGVTALLIDTANSCSRSLKCTCRLFISAKQDGFNGFNKTLRELFIVTTDTDINTIKFD